MWFYAACCVAYAVSGAYLNVYGADAPLIMRWYDIDAATQGLLVTMQSIGGTAGAVFLAFRGEWFNRIYSLTSGCLLLGGGCVLMGIAPPFALLGLLAIAAGLGFTLIDVNVNGVIADVWPERKGTLLALGHAGYGAGAMLSPSMAALLASTQDPRTFGAPFLAVGAVALAVFVIAAVSGRLLTPATPYRDLSSARRNVQSNAGEVFRSPLAWILLVAGILYFSFQLGVASWLPSWGMEAGMSFEDANFLTSGFFAGQLVMSIACALILRHVSAGKLFGMSGLASAACMAAALLIGQGAAVPVLVTASGFFQGSGVITLIVVLTDAFPTRSASASSIQVIGANSAALTAPLWMGWMADYTGFSLPLLVACILYAAGCVIVLRFAGNPAAEAGSKSA